MTGQQQREAVRRALARPAPAVRVKNTSLRPAAVLCPLLVRDGGMDVLLTRRAEGLADHAGQISFPGGRIDDRDEDPLGAALREAQEEVGLNPDEVEVAGALPLHATGTGYLIHPFVGFVSGGFEPAVDSREVAEAFTVPLAFAVDPRNRRSENVEIGGQLRRYYAIPYAGYHIWGATAGILKSFSDLLES